MGEATISLDFAPDGPRARALNAAIHRELGLSLRHVCEASRGELAFDEAAMSRLIDGLLGGVDAQPETIADYYDLVAAIDSDDEAEARRLFDALARAEPASSGLEILALGDLSLGSSSERFIRMMNAEGGGDLGFLPPRPEVAEAFRVRLEEGLALLRRSLAPLDQEFRAIIRRIIIIGSDPSKPFDVDGGSHYQLWGALFLNGEHHPDALGVAEVLAHESAHSLLFGFCMDEPLVENRDEELYASPLRADLRPMDGIYHATFVSARMHWAMSQLAGDPGLSAADRARAAAAAATDRENFEAGYGVVAEHGRLTPLGRTLMERARSYMDAAPSPGG